MRNKTDILIIFVTLLIGSTIYNILPSYAQINSTEKTMNGITTTINLNNLTSSSNNQAIENETINAKSNMFNIIDSKIRVSLSEAADIAEVFIGSNNSRAVMSQLDEYNGYLAYVVCIIDPSMNLTHVYIDPGNGKIVDAQNASMKEAMMMHGKMFMG